MGLVALVGRPNVGKSALFNRLTQTPRAIVEDTPGVTRDRLYEDTDWNGLSFTVVDTGGIGVDDDTLLGMTRRQTEIAVEEADVIVFVVDGQAGLNAIDESVADRLRRTRKPVVLAVNKAESHKLGAAEFYRLGLGEPHLISATHGEGIGDLLDRVTGYLQPVTPPADVSDDAPIQVAIVGRPNVGKSSLLNALSGQERTLVTPIAGTTRDVVDSLVEHGGRRFLLLDTAGLRRPNRVDPGLEEKTVRRTLKALRNADVALMMVDASQPLTAQDQRIAGQIANARRAVVVLLNKADLVKGSTVPTALATRETLKFLPYAEFLPISVATGWHLERLWPAIEQAYQSTATRLATHPLNQAIQEATHLNPPPTVKGRSLKVYYATQVSAKPPHFVLFVNDPELVHFSYERYLENRLRERFGFAGSPLVLSFRGRRRREEDE